MKDGWIVKKLGEVATYINGYPFKPTQWEDSGIPIIRIQNLNNENSLYNYYKGELSQKYVVEYGDILISWSASLGVYEWKGPKSYLNQHIFKVVFDKIDINKYFLKYAVSGKLNEMLKDAHGATMKHVVKKDFDNTKIPIPPLPEQSRIVEELDQLSNIIEKKRQQLSELDNLAQSIFYDMFGDPVVNEKGWEVKKFHEFGKVIGGYAFVSESFSDEGVPVLKIGNINSGSLKMEKICFYKYDESLSNYFVYPNDIVISLTGTVGKDDYGNVCILPNLYDAYYLNQRNAKLEAKDYCSNLFLKFLFADRKIKTELTKNSRGVRQANISNNDIYNLSLILPPLSLQQLFAQKIEAIEAEKALIKQSIAETEELFNSRMDFYFG